MRIENIRLKPKFTRKKRNVWSDVFTDVIKSDNKYLKTKYSTRSKFALFKIRFKIILSYLLSKIKTK